MYSNILLINIYVATIKAHTKTTLKKNPWHKHPYCVYILCDFSFFIPLEDNIIKETALAVVQSLHNSWPHYSVIHCRLKTISY